MPKTNRLVLNKGYSEAGASLDRRALKGFRPSSGSPREDINANNATLRQRSRMLYMSSPLATSAINTNRTKVVGPGLTIKSAINRDVLSMSSEDAKTWQKRTEAEFRLWADKGQTCDMAGLNNFESLQQLAMKSWLMSGDVFVVVRRERTTPMSPYGLRLQLVEADRICTPTINAGTYYNAGTDGIVPDGKPGAGHRVFDGVEVDDSGKVIAYHICSVHPHSAALEKATWTRVDYIGKRTGIPNILHIMEGERPDQYRGVPYLSQVIEPLLQLRRYTESELMAALVQSFFTAWIVTKTDQSEIPMDEVGAGDVNGVPGEDPGGEVSRSENEYEMGPATVAHLAPGEDIKFGSPQIPTAGFETFVKTLAKLVGAGLEMPYDVLTKEFNSSYSAARGALLEAWEAFKMRRKWFVDKFCQPVYEIWLAEAVALGRIQAPGFFDDPILHKAWCGARWIGPVQGSLDPKKEAEAAIMLVDRAIKTHDQVTREQSGGDWEDNVAQLAYEKELLPGNQDVGSEDTDNEQDTGGAD